jgi:glucosamine--fructose-6-phosphate aminotransferase (isomerizing)
MCGIIGATGEESVLSLLLDALHRLEYRGYDSAGVALVAADGVWVSKAARGTTSIAALGEQVDDAPTDRVTGIGHTRWATHGKPTEHNAHPHLDCTGRLALIHNGIIENHAELAAGLESAGHRLVSDTDSEVLAHLMEAELAVGTGLTDAVRAALTRVRGAFAVAVVHADDPELVVAARRVSPLVVGLTDHSALLASDIPALLGRTRNLFALEDDQVAELRPGSISVTDLEGSPVDLDAQRLTVEWDLEAAQKAPYTDFMSKEIDEQPRAVANTLTDRRRPDGALVLDEVRITDEQLQAVDKVCIVACGSSYHAAMVAKYAIERWARLPVEIDIASEFRYRDPVLNQHTLAIGVSQSGETVDTLQAMRHARQGGARVLVVCNVLDSSMARDADGVMYTRAGPEVGVAATKTYLAQVAALEVLALTLAERRSTLPAAEIGRLLDGLAGVPDLLWEALTRADDVDSVAHKVMGARDFFFLGRHVGFPTALEGALKLKELSYLRAEGYPAGELKHGPIALIEPGTVVVAVATRNPLSEKLLSNVAEVRSRGATVVVVADDGDEATATAADHVLWVPPTDPLFSPMVNAVPLEFLAYRLALLLGHDVDRPRNLAKTVTVE